MYGGVLALLCIGFVWGLATREPLRVDVLRDRAALAREVEGGMIENVYNLQVMNMSEQARSFGFEVSGLPGVKMDGQGAVEVAPASTQTVTLRVLVPYDAGRPGANPIFFDVRSEDDPSLSVREESTFLFPR
jgi:polyferredoxin